MKYDDLAVYMQKYIEGSRLSRQVVNSWIIRDPWKDPYFCELLYRGGCTETFSFASVQELVDGLQKIELRYRPKEAWELHH